MSKGNTSLFLLFFCFNSNATANLNDDEKKQDNIENKKYEAFHQQVILSRGSQEIESKEKRKIGLSDILAGGALLFSIITFLYTQKRTKKDHFSNHLRSINDDYWLRTVILPNFVAPIIELIQNSPSKLKKVNYNLPNFYKSYYRQASNLIRERTVFFSAISNELQNNLLDRIDELDDELSDLMQTPKVESINEPLAKFLNTVVELIKKEQIRLTLQH